MDGDDGGVIIAAFLSWQGLIAPGHQMRDLGMNRPRSKSHQDGIAEGAPFTSSSAVMCARGPRKQQRQRDCP
jgi:hypothetical protein